MMDSTKHRFFAPCPGGLEGVLEEELHVSSRLCLGLAGLVYAFRYHQGEG